MAHLQEFQYKDSSNFNARIYLTHKFGTNKYPWPLWVFDNFAKEDNLKILDIGGGNGLLWKLNANRIPGNWDIKFSDFSQGMLNDAMNNIGDRVKNIAYEIIDAENIPYENNTFDIIIANHMLYHVPNRKKALSEVRRVLKDEGTFYSTTLRGTYMKEVRLLISEFKSKMQHDDKPNAVIKNFSIENGEEQLKEFFKDVKLQIYENSLIINEIEPLINYIYSLNNMQEGKVFIEENDRAALTEFLKTKMLKNGDFVVPSDFGLFISKRN